MEKIIAILISTLLTIITPFNEPILPQASLEPIDYVIYMEGLPETIQLHPFSTISEQDGMANYVTYIEADYYNVEQQDNLLRITPNIDIYPIVFMEIKQIPNVSVMEMEAEITNSKAFNNCTTFHTPSTEDFPFVRIEFYDGDERDSTVTNFYIRDNSHGGVFVATAQYFTEAVGGHGVRFMHYLKTLVIIET